MLCTVLITKKYPDEEFPTMEWDEEEPGILEIYVNHTDGQKACITIDAEFLNMLGECIEEGYSKHLSS
jgi:hypothetical protein